MMDGEILARLRALEKRVEVLERPTTVQLKLAERDVADIVARARERLAEDLAREKAAGQ